MCHIFVLSFAHLSSFPQSAVWWVVLETEILTGMNSYNFLWEVFSCLLWPWLSDEGGPFPLAPGEDLGIQPLSYPARVQWPLGAMLYTNLTCMQGLSGCPCWPDSVLAVTHLLLHSPYNLHIQICFPIDMTSTGRKEGWQTKSKRRQTEQLSVGDDKRWMFF